MLDEKYRNSFFNEKNNKKIIEEMNLGYNNSLGKFDIK